MDKVIGRIPVLECLRAGTRKARRLFVLRDAKGLGHLLRLAKEARVPTEERSRRDLDALSGGSVHQGVVLEADPIPVHLVDDWLAAGFPDDAIVVVLDGVVDPHNFGAILRSAAACGAFAVVFAQDHAAPLSAVTAKSAAGAMEYVPLVRAANLVRAMEGLKQAGFWIAALDAHAPQTLWQADLRGRVALAVGSEGKGLRRLVRDRCDLHLKIPLTGPITSLNASVSAAVALAECLRQRQTAAPPE